MALTLFDLTGKRPPIKGCSQGIGIALAQGLMAARALNGRNAAKLTASAAMIPGTHAPLNDAAPDIGGCSALRRTYRDPISSGAVRFVHRAGSREIIATRMPATLPDITGPMNAQADAILADITGETA